MTILNWQTTNSKIIKFTRFELENETFGTNRDKTDPDQFIIITGSGGHMIHVTYINLINSIIIRLNKP